MILALVRKFELLKNARSHRKQTRILVYHFDIDFGVSVLFWLADLAEFANQVIVEQNQRFSGQLEVALVLILEDGSAVRRSQVSHSINAGKVQIVDVCLESVLALVLRTTIGGSRSHSPL